jgi:sn-glycerol 3-phosphate transport system ATP-binding protein
MVAGLEEITGGEIAIGGKHRQPTRACRARHRHGVPELRALPAHERVRQHGLRPEDREGLPKAEIEAACAQGRRILELRCGLLERKPRQLSGGQRQRVAMGRAIVRQPRCSCSTSRCPTLTPSCAPRPGWRSSKLHTELGITSLFVTHDQVEAMTLAQRMIVMNAGRVEQIGTPEEVYMLARPRTFVAGFIGSPPMNLLPGSSDGSRFTVGGQTLQLPAAAPRGGALTLGARPEHAEIHAQGSWPLKVELLEMLGAERLVYGRLGDAMFTLRIDATQVPPRSGDIVNLHVPPEHLHWFDSSTGQRV